MYVNLITRASLQRCGFLKPAPVGGNTVGIVGWRVLTPARFVAGVLRKNNSAGFGIFGSTPELTTEYEHRMLNAGGGSRH